MNEHLSNEALAVIEKVQKLLALAGNNPNENEASAASAKAMELLAAYNLDMAVVGKTAKGSQRSDNKLKGGLYSWQRDLWQSVSKLNFCMYWSIKGLQKGSTYEHRILGRQENVVGATVLAEYLQGAVERLTQSYAKEHGYNVFCREMIAYREGMSRRLCERLEQMRRDKLAEDKKREDDLRAKGGNAGNAVVLASVVQSEYDLNTDHLYGREPGTTARMRAEQQARQAAADAAYAEEVRKTEQWALDNPEEALALRLKKIEEEAERQRKWAREEEKKAKRRKQPAIRYRNMTPQEERARMGTFQQGYAKGDSVSLNRQVGDGKKDRLS